MQRSPRGVRHVRAVMHVGIVTRGGGENIPVIPGACATPNFMTKAHMLKLAFNWIAMEFPWYIFLAKYKYQKYLAYNTIHFRVVWNN